MEQNVITPEEMQALVKAQQGELDAVLMYKALADTVEAERDKKVFLRIAEDEGRHAAVFRKLTGQALKPERTKSVIVPKLYRLIGRDMLYPLIARGEYAAAKKYQPLTGRFPEVESVRHDEKRHGDVIKRLLQ